MTEQQPWTDAPLVALDLEGTGAQDRDEEAILEIAAVPLADGLPAMEQAYESLINPGRPVPRRPWISPGLTDAVLAQAPSPGAVGPDLAARLEGRYLVGHNVGVDWRLLHRRFPDVHPAGMIDTLRLAKRTGAVSRSLSALVEGYELTECVGELVPDGRPHRALWDTVAAALLLPELITDQWPSPPSFASLLTSAGERFSRHDDSEQQTLL